MKYRKFGRLDWQVSVLGFGLEKLPEDESESVKMLRLAIDGGVNLIDAGSPPAYEVDKHLSNILHEALKDGYRQKVKLVTALPSYKIRSARDFDRHLEELLKWLQEDSVDFLLLGGLNRDSWPELVELKVLDRVENTLADRKIGHIGFFFHDQYQFLREIIEAYDNWACCQFHYSYMDIDHHPGATGLAYASENGLGVLVNKPLLGGRLTKQPPESVARVWSETKPQRSRAEWGLRWAWNHRDISCVVVDMSNTEQVKENLALADEAEEDSFSVPEELVISKVRDAYRALKPLPCTACRGCMPCPQGIDAPRIFEIYNDAVMYDDAATAKSIYRLENHNIDSCDECGKCTDKCGFNYPIPEWLKKAGELLSENG
jgi:predicted aldo/keto reductase-like oxidoreductase